LGRLLRTRATLCAIGGRTVHCWRTANTTFSTIPGRQASSTGQLGLARLDRLVPEVAAIELQEIERDQRHGCIAPAIAEQFEIGEAVGIGRDHLAVDRTRAHRERLNGRDDRRKPSAPRPRALRSADPLHPDRPEFEAAIADLNRAAKELLMTKP
jgi:hypothetical protein